MFGNLLQQLQSGYKSSPMQAPAALPTQMPSTQQNMSMMNALGRTGFTPNYTGLFGAMGMQPSTQMPTAPTTPTDNPQMMDQQTLIDQLVKLNLLYPKPQGYYGSDSSMNNSQYWNPAQMAMWNEWQWQSQRDGG